MLQIFNVIVPVFAIMVLGYLSVRLRLYPAEGVRGLVAFVNNFATPCLLFEAMLTSDFSSTFNVAIIGPFYVGALTSLFVGAFIARRVFGNRPGESVSSGFSAMFTNTVLIGIPIIQRAYGDEAMPTAFSIIALHAPMLITLGMLVMELTRRDGAPLLRALGAAFLRILQNPLLWGVALGLLGNRFGVKLPEPGTAFFTMAVFKLIIHPAIAYVLMIHILHVPMDIARYGILLAAMPSGINAYVFATYYDRAVNVATNVILITTVCSVLTVTAWLLILGV